MGRRHGSLVLGNGTDSVAGPVQGATNLLSDVTDDIQKLVRAGDGGRAVDLERLADLKAPLGELLG